MTRILRAMATWNPALWTGLTGLSVMVFWEGNGAAAYLGFAVYVFILVCACIITVRQL